MLCLGDSYTIGEAVDSDERFAHQAVKLLAAKGLYFEIPHIIAQTGWTTDELAAAIRQQNIQKKFDAVTLLIGVNNQYRGRTVEEYRKEFAALLQTALQFANNIPEHVFVLSIPDWSVTPFARNDRRSASEISTQIDLFNEAARNICRQHRVPFLDVTTYSRRAATDPALLAKDGLHPSGAMYRWWAEQLAELMLQTYPFR